jgi:hypothetical protein
VKGRLAFTPSPQAREYFNGLVKRLTRERDIDVRVTQREAFDRMVYLAQKGEAALASAVILQKRIS